ncbi:RRP12-like protein isoform X2 [Lineus longissimus]
MFTVHHKPKVRKAAQMAVCVILKGSTFMTEGDPPAHHPAAPSTAKFCIQQIEEHGAGKDATTTLHVLSFLKEILGCFPQNSLKSACETILRLMTLSNVMITSLCMQALHGMFVTSPKSTTMPSELNAQIITALYDFQPGDSDSQLMAAWLAVMEKAHINLARLNVRLCISHLPRLFTTCVKCFQAEKQEVHVTAASTLKSVLQHCIAPNLDVVQTLLDSTPEGTKSPIHKMFASLEGGLSYQYHASWGHIIQMLAVFFSVLGKNCHKMTFKCLKSLCDLRDSHRFAYKPEVDRAIGMAVTKMGPKAILSAVPLQITGDEMENFEFPRGWLLPVLRDNIKETELAFFTSYFLPLSAKLRTRSAALRSEGQIMKAKLYETLQNQIWALLSGFCNRPTDLAKSFPTLAKVLGSALTERPELRMEVMSALRKLILHNLENEENKKELARFAKNYLPILFNLYTTESTENTHDPARPAALETIKIYLQIADKELTNSLFDKCYGRLLDKDSTALRRHNLLDLINAFIPYIDKARLKKLSELVVPRLNDKDRTTQKKSYRALEEICSSKSENCRNYVATHLSELQSVLINSLSSSSPSSKAPRLRCLIHIFRQLSDDQRDFLMAVVPEAILCTKEVAERARTAAYTLLVEMCEALIRWTDKPKQEVIFEYFQRIMAGFAGDSHMISATTHALTRILHQYKGDVNGALLDVLMDQASLLLSSKAREVVQAALGFVKVLLSAFKDVELAKYLENLISSLVSMKEDNKHHFRFKAKELFERLIRKFGFVAIEKMVPASHSKLLQNIRKTQERLKRQRKAEKKSREDGDSDDDEFKFKSIPESVDELLRDTDSELDEDDKAKPGKKGAKKSAKKERPGAAWLKESNDDDIVDFLDTSASKKVLATKPQVKPGTSGIQHDFKLTPDGRLIITGDKEEEMPKPSKEEAMDDLEDLLDAFEGPTKKSKKRRFDDDEDDEHDDRPAKYRAGGGGIHRPIAVAKRETGKTGGEYRAKKAGGDIKKKGKPDPYAYVPLNQQVLNKRKTAKLKGQFTHFVKGAKKGASQGRKARVKKSGRK